MSGFSIEIGHIYQDMELNNEYASFLLNSIDIVNKKNIKFTSIKLLIDDLNINEKTWSVNDLISFFDEHKINVDFLFFESKFSSLAENFISYLPSHLISEERFRKDKKTCYFINNGKQKIKIKEKYDSGHIHYSCPLLSCLWQLCRLGVYKFPKDSFFVLNENKDFYFNKTLTIIDKKYLKIEKNVIFLLSFIIDTNKVHHHFI